MLSKGALAVHWHDAQSAQILLLHNIFEFDRLNFDKQSYDRKVN